MHKNNVVSFDVRDLIAGGTDPFQEIMERIQVLKKNETLEIINSFEPIPLINVLKSEGFTCEVIRKGDLVHAFFKKVSEVEIRTTEEVTCSAENTFDAVYKTYIGKMDYVDVRMLEMPEPMTTILEKLEHLSIGYCLLVDHSKVPQFLLPELKKRNFNIFYNKIDENHLQLLITRT
ncbi:DUF2249 domain-containing protein [Lutibacter holmesii]|uniref:DUF2249 domain-containing protein n=1 Tax=Lutibacter holmesii TaxID=1137985 RepID=A0ABW3WPC4_9FLAO